MEAVKYSDITGKETTQGQRQLCQLSLGIMQIFSVWICADACVHILMNIMCEAA